ncbi:MULTISPECIES: porin OmpC [Photorhabdus]|uniref:Outer membrane protein N (Porin OmpN) n=2 Tax=Photorhabdus laumondii subsp. laumondii TaxID=141679 RepID=Q7N624_PHOLL|nr:MULTISPECIES: porin OmpC [Photorhabdus]AXG46909.1 porin OmpC [Photorhabdus laumondii subsp. laumondii]KTL60970.1 porin [Photorhabdus laumondii subsp. laumondii]RAW71031.1 porin OmpC [Photorhabdus sp. S14-60]RAW74704.1 porin OmpC [Photorhabdus sp. S7-51]RAW80025.1 porin OmpC [Photorhabdus sp. S15-56]
MMKRNVLAVVIPALLAAGAANAAEVYNKDGNKLDLYGKVEVQHKFANNKSGEDGDNSFARLGFKGETQVNDQLTGFGRWEYNIKGNRAEGTDEETKTRLAFAGLKLSNYGSLNYGRNYGVVYDVNAWTDVLPVFGGDSMAQTDNFMTGRSTGLLTYRNTDFFGLVDGLNFALQYQGENSENTANSRINRKDNGDGYGFSATYDVGYGISVGGAYSNSARTSAQKTAFSVVEEKGKKDKPTGSTALGDRAESWNIGAKYDANNIYLAAMYGETRNMTRFGGNVDGVNWENIANKTQNIELTAQYQFDFGLRPSLAYVQSKGKNLLGDDGKESSSRDLVKYISVGSYYYFNKNLTTYVDYKINLLDSNEFTKATGTSTDNVVGVGMIYQF